jgi:hypothetical protein
MARRLLAMTGIICGIELLAIVAGGAIIGLAVPRTVATTSVMGLVLVGLIATGLALLHRWRRGSAIRDPSREMTRLP